jgi:ferredoxin
VTALHCAKRISAVDEKRDTVATPRVTFVFSKKTVDWDEKYASILELAEAQGLTPDFSCRSGICRSCECELLSGALTYVTEPLEMPDEGMALICCSKPAGDVELNI